MIMPELVPATAFCEGAARAKATMLRESDRPRRIEFRFFALRLDAGPHTRQQMPRAPDPTYPISE
jgi:hypothetical protein